MKDKQGFPTWRKSVVSHCCSLGVERLLVPRRIVALIFQNRASSQLVGVTGRGPALSGGRVRWPRCFAEVRSVSGRLPAARASLPSRRTARFGRAGHLRLPRRFLHCLHSSHSNRDLPGPYKFAVLWSGQEGSLLFWSLLLAAYGFVLACAIKTDPRLFAYASVVLSGCRYFFSCCSTSRRIPLPS